MKGRLIVICLIFLLLTGCSAHGVDKEIYSQGKSYAQMMIDAKNGNDEKLNSEYDKILDFVFMDTSKHSEETVDYLKSLEELLEGVVLKDSDLINNQIKNLQDEYGIDLK